MIPALLSTTAQIQVCILHIPHSLPMRKVQAVFGDQSLLLLLLLLLLSCTAATSAELCSMHASLPVLKLTSNHQMSPNMHAGMTDDVRLHSCGSLHKRKIADKTTILLAVSSLPEAACSCCLSTMPSSNCHSISMPKQHEI